MSVTPEEELAVLREFAEKAAGNWLCMGDFYVDKDADWWTARRMRDGKREVDFREGSFLGRSLHLAECVLNARRKLQTEQDAKDAPKLRELLEEFTGAVHGTPTWTGDTLASLTAMRDRMIKLRSKVLEALKETP